MCVCVCVCVCVYIYIYIYIYKWNHLEVKRYYVFTLPPNGSEKKNMWIDSLVDRMMKPVGKIIKHH